MTMYGNTKYDQNYIIKILRGYSKQGEASVICVLAGNMCY